MTAYTFSTATLIARSTPTLHTPPLLFGVLQDVALDFDQNLESVERQGKVAVALGDGQPRITGKAKFARLQMVGLGTIPARPPTVPLDTQSTGEATSVPAASPYTYLVANSLSAPFEDFGVFYQATGIQLVPVEANPSLGQYSFDEAVGRYTFAPGDAGAAVYIYYVFRATADAEIPFRQSQLNWSPTFEVYFKIATSNFGVSREVTIKLNSCRSNKPLASEASQKFVIPDFDFAAEADSNGNVFTLSTSE